ncbi:major facilitator superfamily transporter [Ilyonectria destructans]|nr:major facilitator superfamily transporter [Ilyonectria destructans]
MGSSSRRVVDKPSSSASSSSEETPLLSEQPKISQNGELVIARDSMVDSDVEAPKPQPVSWASIPRKGQLAIMVFARLAEPLSERSLTSYLFYQLRWLDPALNDSEIAKRAGYLTAVFAAAQCLTSMWWGHAADSPLFGRKRVLLIGLVGTTMSAIGMGFSTSIYFVFFFRFLAGALNGNIGVLRTMVSEVILDKRYQSRAFLLLPMCFNVGAIIGPLLSGFLAEPITSLPGIFGPGSFFGGKDGVQWMAKFPYALPNLFSALILITAALGIILGLDETHPVLRHKPDRGRQLGKMLTQKILRKRVSDYSYDPLQNELDDDAAISVPTDDEAEQTQPQRDPIKERPAFRSIFTRNVCITLLQSFLQSLHVSAFNSVFFVLLPTPRADNSNASLPFRFTGGLGLSSQKIGFANTIIGTVGIPLQLFVYPRINDRLGVLASYRAFLPLSIVAYFVLPYLVLLPTKAAVVWSCLTVVLSIHVISRVFCGPATMILVNESAPSPTLLGTVHGFASSTSSAARIMGPTIGGSVLGWGLEHNYVGMPLWGMAIVAMVNWVLLLWIKDVDMFH